MVHRQLLDFPFEFLTGVLKFRFVGRYQQN
jgi:hypothetical protein